MLVVNDNVISKIDCICNYACIRNVCTSKELLSLYLNKKKTRLSGFKKGEKKSKEKKKIYLSKMKILHNSHQFSYM